MYQCNLQKVLSSTNVWLSSWCIFPSCLFITSDKIKTLNSRGLIMCPTFLWLEWSSRFQSGFGEKWEVRHHWLLIHSWIKNLLWGYELDKVNYKKRFTHWYEQINHWECYQNASKITNQSILVELTCGIPSQSSACCMASLVLLTRCTVSQLSQSGHKPAQTRTIIS